MPAHNFCAHIDLSMHRSSCMDTCHIPFAQSKICVKFPPKFSASSQFLTPILSLSSWLDNCEASSHECWEQGIRVRMPQVTETCVMSEMRTNWGETLNVRVITRGWVWKWNSGVLTKKRAGCGCEEEAGAKQNHSGENVHLLPFSLEEAGEEKIWRGWQG